MRKNRLRLESLDERAVPDATNPVPPPDGEPGQTPAGSWVTIAADTPHYLGSDEAGNAHYLTGNADGEVWLSTVDGTGTVSADTLLAGNTSGQKPLPPGVYPVPGPTYGPPLHYPSPNGGWNREPLLPPDTRYGARPGWTYYQSPNGGIYGFPPGGDPYLGPPSTPSAPIGPSTRPPATPGGPQPTPSGPVIVGPNSVIIGPGGVYVGPGGTYNGSPRPVPVAPPVAPPASPVPPGTPPPRVEEERTLPGGGTEIRRPDGTVIRRYPNGTVETWRADGTYSVTFPPGSGTPPVPQ